MYIHIQLLVVTSASTKLPARGTFLSGLLVQVALFRSVVLSFRYHSSAPWIAPRSGAAKYSI